MLRVFLAVTLGLLLGGCQQESSTEVEEPAVTTDPGFFAYTNATFWDGTGDESLVDGVLVVRDGRIVSLDAGPAPVSANLVDLGGAYVIPGIINTHGHVSGRWADKGITDPASRVAGDLQLLARYGVTTVNSLGGEPAEAAAIRDAQEGPQLRHTRLYVAGPVIAESDPAAAAAMAEANIAKGVDWLKLRVDDNMGRGEKMPWPAVQAVIDVANDAGMPVATHMFYRDDASRLLEMGTSLLAHSIRDQAIDEAFIEELSDAGVCYVPTLTREVSTFVYAERPKFFDDPFFLEFADPDEMARVSDPAFMTRMADDEFTPRYREAWLQAMENLRTLSDANVPIAFGTDSGPGGRFPGFFEHMELEMMVMAGMSAEQALMSATLDAADCLGLDDVGTLEPGKWADFLVLGADPVADIAATRTLQRVYIAGNEVTR